MDEEEENWGELFGSDDESGGTQGAPVPVLEVPGLFFWKEWLSASEQEYILECIASDGWFAQGNQAMHFGSDLPDWLLERMLGFPAYLLPAEVASRQPLFNQMILNRYNPGDGICPHIDLACFEDGIVVISLGGPAVMHFTQPQRDPDIQVQVLLEGGDLLVLGGPARWEWHHEIKGVSEEVYQGRSIVRGFRTSITLRRMKEGTVLTEAA